jgi:hypothetical protein
LALGFLATKARSDVLNLPVPAELVPGLADALDHLRASAGADRGADLDALARQLADGGPLTARRDLLGELLAVAIDEAGERIGSQSTGLLHGEGSAGELRALLAELGGLLELYERLDA